MTDRKTPFRGKNDISQTFNDGIVTIFAISDGAEPGYMPKPAETMRCLLRYDERRLGIQRTYLARQTMSDVARVIRVPRPPPDLVPRAQDTAITEDGSRYRVDLVQSVPDSFPPSLDLTLAALRTYAPDDNSGGADTTDTAAAPEGSDSP